MITNSELAVALALHGQAMALPTGAVIFQPGEAADGVYIVRSGSVAVQLVKTNGLPFWTRNVSEYAILGLPPTIGNHLHCLRAVARENCELVFIPALQIRRLLRTNPVLASWILQTIGDELCDLWKAAAVLSSNRKIA